MTRPPRAVTARESIAAGATFSLLDTLIVTLVASVPLFADKPILARAVGGVALAVIVAAAVRYLFAVAIGIRADLEGNE